MATSEHVERLGVSVKDVAEAWTEWRFGSEDAPRGAKVAPVDLHARDLPDSTNWVDEHSVRRDYGHYADHGDPKAREALDVYASVVALADLPSPRLAEIEENEISRKACRANAKDDYLACRSEAFDLDDEEQSEAALDACDHDRDDAEDQCERDFPEDGGYDWSEIQAGGSYPAPKLAIDRFGGVRIIDGNHRLTAFEQMNYTHVPMWIVQELPQNVRDARATAAEEAEAERRRALPMTFNLDGFAWPQDTTLYHTTIGYRAIQREGFKVRDDLDGMQATGGGTARAISFAVDPRVCQAILVGLYVLREGARFDMLLADLWQRARSQLPKAAEQAWASFEAEGWTPETIERCDAGWKHGARHTFPVRRAELPEGAEPTKSWQSVIEPHRVGATDLDANERARADMFTEWWEPATPEWRRERFAEHYKRILSFGEGARECYNPVFWGTNMEALAKLDERDLGIFATQARIPRVSPDPAAAIWLGYLTRPEAVRNEDALRSMNDSTERALEWKPGTFEIERPAQHLYARLRAGIDKIGPFTVEDSGERTRASTMVGVSSMSEVRVYDPSRIEINADESENAPAYFERRGYGAITFRYFREMDNMTAPGERVRGSE